MKPAPIILGAALVIVIGTLSPIILKQQAEINALRARETAAHAAATTTPRVESAPAEAPEAPPEPATDMTARATATGPLTVVTPGGEVLQQRPGPRARGANRFAELLADPEVALMMKAQRKAELDGRYAALFKRLGLSGTEAEALKDLLAEKQLARMEANVVARAEGFAGSDREAIREIVSEGDDEIDARMQELLGADRYETLRKFESTSSERARVAQLDLRLSYSPAPLQDYQSDALVEILRSAPEPRPAGRMGTPEDNAAYLGELKAYDEEIYKRAHSVLSPAQLDALRKMQQERQDRMRLNALMRRGGGS